MLKRKITPNPIREWPVNLISNKMGVDRGTAIDRVYIERFLNMNKKYITGTVAEIGDNEYTRKYGQNANSIVLTADENMKAENVILCDLQTGEGCKENEYDCFILTQTLPFIFDIQAAATNILKMLKVGGVALITVGGVSMISEYDYKRWGHFWGFTAKSLIQLFENTDISHQIEIMSYGNAKVASAFIYGLSCEDLDKSDLDYTDDLVPFVLGAVIKK